MPPNESDKGRNQTTADDLRRKAEERLLSAKKTVLEHLPSDEGSQRLRHELEINHIELEIQNEELIRARDETDIALDKFTDLFESGPVGFLILTRNGGIKAVSRSSASLLGKNRTELLGKRFAVFIANESRYAFADLLNKTFANRTKVVCEIALQTDANTPLFVKILAKAASSGEECNVALIDITQRKLAGQALTLSELRYREVVEGQTELIARFLPDGTYTFVNSAHCRFFGKTEDEVIGTKWHTDVASGDALLIKEQLECMSPTNPVVVFVSRATSCSGDIRWIQFTNRGFFDDEGRLVETQAVGRDITELKHMEEELRASEKHYRLLTEDVADVVWKLDNDYRFTYISPADEMLRGYSADEVIGHTIFEITTTEGITNLGEKFSLRQASERQGTRTGTLTFELQQICKDGRLVWTEMLSTPERDAQGLITGYHGITRDITARKQATHLEQQLLHAQKLESLGVLAGGIAHDFNNILMVILGNSNLAAKGISKDSPAMENLQRIEQAVARAADLTKQMLAYSGKGKFVTEYLNLNQQLVAMLPLLEASTSKKALLKLHTHQALPLVEADATQINQIVMNLVINASEAIGEDNGVIDVTTGYTNCDHSSLKNFLLGENLSGGIYVFLEVTDNGCGMDDETISKIFDPFFSTKFTGRGLGMSAVLGIVRGHKGAIAVKSELGKGTTFKILIPARDKPADEFKNDVHDNHEDDWQGQGTVLLVDDEEMVRSLGVAMLRMLGFTTITAKDGQEAVKIFKETPDIAFVVLDLTMPQMDGEQCFRELRRLDPAVKVIMASGYNEQEVSQKFTDEGPSGFIQKPYSLADLRTSIKRIV